MSNIGAALRSGVSEKTFIDKLLGREDIQALKEIIKTEVLEKETIRTIKYLISSAESKLLNLDDRLYYIINKYYLWIGELIKIYEMFLDYDESLKEKFEEAEYKELKLIMHSAKRRFSHVVKTSVDIYINICRTTMSKDALAFKEILTNKFDYSYSSTMPQIPGINQNNQGGIIRGPRNDK